MNNRAIIFTLLIFITALATNIFLDRRAPDAAAETEPSNEPDMYMLNATISQFDESGFLTNRIRADRFTHFPLTDMTVMVEPGVNLFSATDAPWTVDARNGRLLSRSAYRQEALELWDEVVAIQEKPDGKFVRIDADAMTLFPGRDYAESNRQVRIQDHMGTTTAAGMQAFLGEGRYVFYGTPTYRVSTQLEPGSFSQGNE